MGRCFGLALLPSLIDAEQMNKEHLLSILLCSLISDTHSAGLTQQNTKHLRLRPETNEAWSQSLGAWHGPRWMTSAVLSAGGSMCRHPYLEKGAHAIPARWECGYKVMAGSPIGSLLEERGTSSMQMVMPDSALPP